MPPRAGRERRFTRSRSVEMVCPKCGAQIPEDRAFCPGCREPLISVEPPEAEPDAAAGEVTRAAIVRVIYAGFWLRFLAFVVDWVGLSILLGPLVALLFPHLELLSLPLVPPADPVAAQAMVEEFWRT